MAESNVESVVVNDIPNNDSSVDHKSPRSQRLLMSAALIIDAKDGLLLLHQSTHFINVKLYFLYRHSVFQYMLYLTIFLHHFMVMFETKSDINDIWVHTFEVICLLIYSLRLSHLLLFTSSQVFWSDKKNVIVVAAIVMTFSDIVISNLVVDYIRWTPVLRPLFLINFAENKQIRRTFRNIRNTLPDVLNVLILFFLSILTFSIIGLKLFEKQSIFVGNEGQKEKYFSNFFDIFYNLYVLVTTANNPDVMMPAYNKSRWFAIYFVIFLIINLYLFMNIILAVIYNNYRKHLKKEVRSLLNQKRENVLRAFSLLVKDSENTLCSQSNDKNVSNTGVTQEVFSELMQIVLEVIGSRAKHGLTLISIYWSLLESNQMISSDSFCQILDLLNLEINILSKAANVTIVEKLMKDLYRSRVSTLFRILVKSKRFRNFFDFLILLNAIIIAFNYDYSYIEWVLLLVFAFEILAKLYTFGLILFLQKFWNIFDLVVIGMALILWLIIEFKHSLKEELEQYLDLLLILRVLRLCKIITTINRFKVVVKTVIALMPSIASYIGLLFVIYYSYAILGMRLFPQLRDDTRNSCQTNAIHCCPKNETLSANYCTINFNTFPNAMLYLFDLMLVNQWHILAKTQELVSQTKLIRIYFISFHLICVILVLNIFTAFVLEAFILEYIDLTEKKVKKSHFQLRLEQLGVNCLEKRDQPVISAEYTHFEDLVDADHDFVDSNGDQTKQESNDFWLSFNYSDLKIIIKEKKSVELLLIKMFRNEISSEAHHSHHSHNSSDNNTKVSHI